MAVTRFLELVFFVYFVVHIPVSILFDSQGIFPREWYPDFLVTPKLQYTTQFKDVLFGDPPIWFQSFIYAETFFQLPFFFVAAYAFYKGNCKWIRIPAIVYSTHVATTVIPIVAEIYLSDFAHASFPGPSTFQERTTLVGIYAPFLVVPFIMLVTMLFSAEYRGGSGRKQKAN
ncbi:sigma intracellular receptor 2 [Strongylocentrotus purpuratus]|uniref:Sigma intracellular receptor 2 n=1 Tax=Strongylocentrotus purpuratus TaxID=7668 RepID=A0A7M7RH85_STRPU|nr:sigma intracellular receptor 2 [Strongylocentrotus purpuratus]